MRIITKLPLAVLPHRNLFYFDKREFFKDKTMWMDLDDLVKYPSWILNTWMQQQNHFLTLWYTNERYIIENRTKESAVLYSTRLEMNYGRFIFFNNVLWYFQFKCEKGREGEKLGRFFHCRLHIFMCLIHDYQREVSEKKNRTWIIHHEKHLSFNLRFFYKTRGIFDKIILRSDKFTIYFKLWRTY